MLIVSEDFLESTYGHIRRHTVVDKGVILSRV